MLRSVCMARTSVILPWQSTSLANGMVFSLGVDSAGVLFAGTNAAGAQVSTDHGTTWSVLQAGIEGANKFGYGVWINPNDGRKIFVSSEFGYGMQIVVDPMQVRSPSIRTTRVWFMLLRRRESFGVRMAARTGAPQTSGCLTVLSVLL